MTSASHQLLQHTVRHVTPKDVSDFCPSDPGYSNYVREFAAILSSGVLPIAFHFDITETVGLTWWVEASREPDPIRFRRFRTFTNAVGVAISTGAGPDDRTPLNYCAISLIDDAHALRDLNLLRLLFPVFAELRQRVAETGHCAEETPFLILGQLIIAFMGFAPSADIAGLGEQLIAEESLYAGHASPEFLWGCTYFDQLHGRWKHFVELSFPRCADNDSTLALLRDALLSAPANTD